MVIGGVDEDVVEVIDAADLGAGWRRRAPLPQKRHNTNSVLTPDGAVITIGGNLEDNYISPQKEALRYDPATDAWTPMAAQAEERGYHSTALLLPDGRIVSAGDDGPSGPGGQSDEIEVFSPAYLFKGPRPQITSAPVAVPYGSTFGVGTPDGDVAKAVLVAPGATTHANDMHQRLVPLVMTRTAGGLQLTAPASTSIAPPGHYMLFLVNSAGVPSVARFVHLAPAAPLPPPEPPPPPPPGTGGGTTAPGATTPGRVDGARDSGGPLAGGRPGPARAAVILERGLREPDPRHPRGGACAGGLLGAAGAARRRRGGRPGAGPPGGHLPRDPPGAQRPSAAERDGGGPHDHARADRDAGQAALAERHRHRPAGHARAGHGAAEGRGRRGDRRRPGAEPAVIAPTSARGRGSRSPAARAASPCRGAS